MAKAKKTTAPKWLEVRIGSDQHVLFGPAETLVKWGGSKGTGPVKLHFTYWKALADQLPSHVRPAKDGPTHTLEVASEDAVKATIKELTAWLKARDPNLKSKKKTSTMIYIHEGSHLLVDAYPITVADRALDDIGEREVGTVSVDGKPLLYWIVKKHDLHVRATADEIVFVDADEAPPIDTVFEGGAAHGTWTCKELLVASWLPAAITDYKGIETASVAELAAVKGKALKPTTNDYQGGATAVAATGTFRAETGSTDGARWCRFVRA